jgi:triacylglycerol lipase
MDMPKVIRDVEEKPLVLYTDARRPLSQMSFLERALALGELSMIAYNDESEARRAGRAIGFPQVELLDCDGAQAYVFRNDHDCVVAFRGTQATEWNDIQADARATLAVIGTLGRVHSGFNRELDDIWPLMRALLADIRLPLYFCGHSLGGGVATLAAYRCRSEALPNQPLELHTFGSPRVADHRYVGQAMLKHYRWVHNNDIVTREPPRRMGYWHSGSLVYLDRHGRIRRLSAPMRQRDRLYGFMKGLGEGQIDMLSDHRIHRYVEHIRRAVEQESRTRAGTGLDGP